MKTTRVFTSCSLLAPTVQTARLHPSPRPRFIGRWFHRGIFAAAITLAGAAPGWGTLPATDVAPLATRATTASDGGFAGLAGAPDRGDTVAAPDRAASAATLYVSPSGNQIAPYGSLADATRSIQSAVDLAAAGDVVLVAAGTYVLTAPIQIAKGITVRSIDGASVTTVDGNNATRCVFLNHASAVVEGFTITRGLGQGGGVYVEAFGTVRSCTIADNRCVQTQSIALPGGAGGAGVFLHNGGTVETSLITGNSITTPFTMGAYGGGIYCDGGGLVDRCRIENNSGSDGGGGVYVNGSGSVRNCLIVGNRATVNYGGGIALWKGGVVENCTVSANQAYRGGGLMAISDSGGTTPQIRNTIISGNTAASEYADVNVAWSYGGGTYTNNCTSLNSSVAPLPGAGNLTGNPLFVNTAAGNYRLQAGSPCIDSGGTLAWTATAVDLDGQPRTNQGTVDMGAFETVVTGAVPVITSATTAAATVGTAFSFPVTASHSPTAFAVTGTLPSGIAFNPATGVFNGTPTAAGASAVTLTATNATGTSAAVTLTITVTAAPVAPAITTQPQSQAVAVGATVSFTVVATGTPPLTYQWTRNNSTLADGSPASLAVISGAQSATLTLTGVQAGDVGNYAVVVGGSGTFVTSNPATLTVGSSGVGPSLYGGLLRSQTALVGQTIAFGVTAAGSPVLTYQWNKNSEPISGATHATLNFPSVQLTDAATYTVAVANTFGSITSAAMRLTVASAAPANDHLANAAVITGSTATVNGTNVGASFEAGEPDHSGFAESGHNHGGYSVWWQWTAPASGAYALALTVASGGYLDPILAVYSGPTFGAFTRIVGGFGGTVSFFASAGVSYRLAVDGSFGSASAFTLALAPTTGEAVAILHQPMGQGVLNGQDVFLSVTAAGTAPLTYQWKKGGAALADGGNVVGTSTSMLRISSAQLTDAGDYTVVITNPLNSVTSNVATVSIGDPVVNYPPQSQTVSVGGTAGFGVSASGTPPLTYRWRKGSAALTDSATLSGSTTSSLLLSNVQLADAGDYSVVVTNGASASVTSAAATLTVNAAPPGPANDHFANRTALTGLPVTATGTNVGATRETGEPTYHGSGGGSVWWTWTAPNSGNVIIDTNGSAFDTLLGVYTGTSLAELVRLADDDDAGEGSASLVTISAVAGGVYQIAVGGFGGSAGSIALHVTTAGGGSAVPAITSLNLAAATVGTAFTYSITATNAPTGFGATALPPGLSLNPTTGVISGTPTTAGSSNVILAATNGSGASPDFTLTIVVSAPVAPTITAQPVSLAAAPGATVTFTVVANGTGPLSYVWQKNGVTLADATTATLTLANVASAATGSYAVVVTGAVGNVTSRAALLFVGVPGPVVAVSAGSDFSLFLTNDGVVWGMGNNNSGQLAGCAMPRQVLPAPVFFGVQKIAAGLNHSLFLKTDGTLWSVGFNVSGQLGDGTTTARDVPVQIATDVAAMVAGYFHSLFIKTNGSLWAAGDNTSGQLGDGTTTNRLTPVQVVASGVTAAACSNWHSLFLKSDATLWATGANDSGQLCDSTTTNRTAPVQVATDVSAVAAGWFYSLFVKSNGDLWAVGNNDYGQLGDGTTTSRPAPVKISTGVAAVSVRFSHALFVKANGTLWTMGENTRGELGDGTTTARLSPVQAAVDVAAAAIGYRHTLFIKTGGSLWGMGDNGYSELGDGTTTHRNSPVLIVGSATADQSLVGWWPADGNALDATLRNAAGVVHGGVSHAVGRIGQAFAFGGADGWVDLGTQTGDFGTADFSIALWVRLNDVTREQVLIEDYVENESTHPGWGVNFKDGALFFGYNGGRQLVSSAVAAERWYHLAVTRSGAAFTLYLDGVAVATATDTAALASTAALKLGHRGAPGDTAGSVDNRGFFLNGALDDVRIYNRALGNTEVQTLATLIPIIETQPVAQTVGAGQTATFTVTASGTPAPTYRWQGSTDGALTWSDLADATPYSGVTTATLTATATTILSRTQFRCVASNPAGSTPSSAALLRVAPATSGFSGNDAFATGSNWSVPTIPSGGGRLAFANGRLEYSVVPSAGDDVALREWTANVGSYTRDWSVQVEVHLAAMTLGSNHYVNLNLIVMNAADALKPFGQSNMMDIAIDRYGIGSSTVHDFGGDLSGNGTRVPTSGMIEVVNSSTDAALRISFNSTTKALTSWFDADGAANGYAWVQLQSVNIGSGTYTWNMTDSGAFAVVLAGGSSGVTVTSGQGHFDNFLASELEPPVIGTQPVSQTAATGTTVTFTVGATGTAPLTYQWKLGSSNLVNGGTLSGATTPTLTLTGVQPADAGSYTCVVTGGNGTGSATSSPALLTVTSGAQPLMITALPRHQTTVVGGTVSFAVTVAGTPPFTYQWRKNGETIPNATNATLTLTNVQLADAAAYTVQITGTSVITSTPLALTVAAAPPGNDLFANATTLTGATVAVTGTNVAAGLEWGEPDHVGHAEAGQNHGGASVWWKWVAPATGAVAVDTIGSNFDTLLAVYRGEAFNALTLIGADDQGGGNTTSALSFAATAGTTYYFAVDGYSTATGAIQLQVAPTTATAPSFRSPLADRTVPAGANVGFYAALNGTAPFTYLWKKDGIDVPGGTTNPLTLRNVAAGAVGSYTLTVTNGVSGTTSNAAVLTVSGEMGALAIQTQPQAFTVPAGGNAWFGVWATGTPPISYQWRKNGTALVNGTAAGGATIAGAASPTLTLTGVQAGDLGAYTCYLSNGLGNLTSDAAALTLPATSGIEGYGIAKLQRTTQVSAGAPAPLSATPFAFEARVFGGSIAGLPPPSFTTPAGSAVTAASLAYDANKVRWEYSSPASYASLAALTADFLNGTYPFTVNAVSVNLALSGSAPVPASPRISGGTWSADALQVVAGSDYALTFDPFSDHVGSNYVELKIVVPGGLSFRRGSFDASTGSFLIPAGTLTAGNTYQARLEFYNLTTLDPTSVPGAIGLAGVGTQLRFQIAATAAVAAPAISSAATAAATVGTAFSYSIVATPGPITLYAFTGTLPAGLALNSTTGVIGGTPTAAGVSTVTLTATNAGGTSPAFTLTLTVNAASVPPAIVTQPVSVAVAVGQSASFTIAGTGTPVPTYQWQRQPAGTTGFVNLAEGSGYSGVTTATLSIAAATASMSGDQFRAIASNGIGTPATSDAATLTVNVAPVFTSPANATFATGRAATFAVVATGQPAPTYTVTTGALPTWVTLNATTGALTGTPPNVTGAPFAFTLTAGNGIAPAATQAFTLTVVLGVPPIITTQPVSRTVAVGTAVSFTVVAGGTSPLVYEWRKAGVPINGATHATFAIASAQTTDTGAYSVAIANGIGTAVSDVATLGVIPPGSGATQAVLSPGYLPGGQLTVTNTFTFTGAPATGLGWRVLLPPGWLFVSASPAQGDTKPALGATDLLEWAWSTPPASPLTFTYTVSVPAGQTGPKEIVALGILRQGLAPIELLAQPDPLLVAPYFAHSADTDRDSRISLLELTRVIELYNTRSGTVRSGRYRPLDGTEDGFATDPDGSGGAPASFIRLHSADTARGPTPRDGRIDLVELTRVIELFNTRSGTVRTGAYHIEAGTEDGFTGGP